MPPSYVTETARNLIETALPTVIRGNASEILSLSAQGAKTRGVDSINSMEDAIEAARAIAASLGTIIAVTGERDLVTDGKRSLIITGGHPLLGYVTGTGCAATVIIAAFLAEEKDPMISTAAALAFFGLAGERAAAQAPTPGSFWIRVVDELYAITPEELENSSKDHRSMIHPSLWDVYLVTDRYFSRRTIYSRYSQGRYKGRNLRCAA